jgi:hypothetical protein
MKKFTFVGLSAVIVVVCILLFWQHSKISRDRGFSQKLAGSWLCEYANVGETYNYSDDGSYTLQEVLTFSNRTNIYQFAGTWQIKDGRIIQISTTDSNKKANVSHHTNTAQIVRLDARNLIVEVATNRMELRRITP